MAIKKRVKKPTTKKSSGTGNSLRDKYKATPLNELQNTVDEEDEMFGSNADFHEIKEGSNKFRIYPKKEGEKVFYVTRVVHWISVENDDGETGRRTVPNARIHGGFKYDIFEKYMEGSSAMLKHSDDKERTKKIAILTDWKKGLRASTTWLCYADKMLGKNKKFAILEYKKSVRDGMNKIASTEDVDETIVIDPFTDCDDGYPIIISYSPAEKKAANKYGVVLAKRPVALTDEELEDFDKVTPLSEMYRNNYTTAHFDLALEGLENYDEEHEIGYFESEEFQEFIEKFKEMVEEGVQDTDEPDDEEEKEQPKSTRKNTKKKQEAEQEDEADDEVEEDDDDEAEEDDAVDLAGMDRKELKAFIKEEELDVTVFKKMSDDDIRDKIVEAMEAAQDDDEAEEVEEDTSTKKAPSLSDIKKKIKAKRK